MTSGTREYVIKTDHKIGMDNINKQPYRRQILPYMDNVTVIDIESRYYQRKIKQAIWIRNEKPSTNLETDVQISRTYDTILTTPQQSNHHQFVIVQY